MSQHLDARQRAMLQEMGVRVWYAPEASAPAAAEQPTNAAPAHTHAPRTSSPVPTAQPRVSTAQSSPPPAVARFPAPSGWNLLPTRLLYPDANPALAPAALGAGWLIVAEAM